MNWVEEHGKEYQVPLAVQENLADDSWHNDTCPSFCSAEARP